MSLSQDNIAKLQRISIYLKVEDCNNDKIFQKLKLYLNSTCDNDVITFFSSNIIIEYLVECTKQKVTMCKALELIMLLLKRANNLPDKFLYKKICLEYSHGECVHPHYAKNVLCLMYYKTITTLKEPSLVSICKNFIIV